MSRFTQDGFFADDTPWTPLIPTGWDQEFQSEDQTTFYVPTLQPEAFELWSPYPNLALAGDHGPYQNGTVNQADPLFFDDLPNVAADNLDLNEFFADPDPVNAPGISDDLGEPVQSNCVLPRKQRKSKGVCPSPQSWRTHRSKIMNLYIDEDKSLEETRAIMKDEYNFDATKQMFKEKFQLWGWSKNLSKSLYGKLSRIADERKPRSTEFRMGPKAWSAEEIRRKAAKAQNDDDNANYQSPDLPNNLIIHTPTVSSDISNRAVSRSRSMVAVSPSVFYRPNPMNSPLSAGSQIARPDFYHMNAPDPGTASRPMSRSGWSATFQFGTNGSMPPPMLPPLSSLARSFTPLIPSKLRGDSYTSGLSPENFKRDLSHALELRTHGRIDESKEKIKEVISEFRRQRSLPEDIVVKAAYSMVDILANGEEVKEAISILDYMTERCLEIHGNRHQKTLSHYLKTIYYLRSWARHGDVRIFIHRIADSYATDAECQTPVITQSIRPFTELCDTISEDDFCSIFVPPGDPEDATAQLRLIELLLSSGSMKLWALKEPLQQILDFCGQRPNDLVLGGLRASCCLAKVYLENNRYDLALEAEIKAEECVDKFLCNDQHMTLEMLNDCVRLAFLFQESRRGDKCEKLLERIAQSIESQLQVMDIFQQTTSLEFFVFVAQQWLKRSSYESAAPWLERALANLSHNFHSCLPMNQALEQTLADREFSPSLNVSESWVDV